MTALKWLREVLQSANTVLLKDHIFLTIGLHVSRLGSRLLKNKYLWVPFHYTCLWNKTRKPSKHNHVNQAYTWLLKHYPEEIGLESLSKYFKHKQMRP